MDRYLLHCSVFPHCLIGFSRFVPGRRRRRRRPGSLSLSLSLSVSLSLCARQLDRVSGLNGIGRRQPSRFLPLRDS